MAGLILRKEEFFPSATQAVAVADRYPQNVFAEHTHEFCELVLVWRGNGLHVLNDRPWRITRGDLFYIRAEDKHSYASVNDLVLQNIIYCPERLQLNFDWAGAIPGLFGTPWKPHWRMGSTGMAQARQVISQLEHECARRDAQGNAMAELLFAQLALTLQRHRYATEDPAATQREALLDKLLAALAASLSLCSGAFLRAGGRQRAGASPAVSPANRDDHQSLFTPAADLPCAVSAAAYRALNRRYRHAVRL